MLIRKFLIINRLNTFYPPILHPVLKTFIFTARPLPRKQFRTKIPEITAGIIPIGIGVKTLFRKQGENVSKISSWLLAGLTCLTCTGFAEAAYEASIEEGLLNRPTTPLAVTNRMVFSYDKKTGAYSVKDNYITTKATARKYVLNIDGVNGSTALYKNTNRNTYTYCAYASTNSCTSTRIGSLEVQRPFSVGNETVKWYKDQLDEIFLQGVEKDYYKFRLSIGSIGISENSGNTWSYLFDSAIDPKTSDSYTSALTSVYYTYYRMPPEDAEGGPIKIRARMESDGGIRSDDYIVTNRYLASSGLYAGHNDTIWLATFVKTADTLTIVGGQCKHYSFNDDGTISVSDWKSIGHTMDPQVADKATHIYNRDIVITDGTAGLKDSIMFCRGMYVYRLADSLGKAILDTAYSDSFKISIYHRIIMESSNKDYGDFKVHSSIKNLDTTYIAPGGNVTYTAAPKDGYRLKCWTANSKCIGYDDTLSVKSDENKYLVVEFEKTSFSDTPKVLLNGKVVSGTIGFVQGRDSVEVWSKSSGPQTISRIVKYGLFTKTLDSIVLGKNYYNDNELVATINKDGFLAMAGSAKDPVSIAPARSADESQFQVSLSQVDETTQKETGFKNAKFNLKWFYLHSYYRTADDAEPVEYVLDFDYSAYNTPSASEVGFQEEIGDVKRKCFWNDPINNVRTPCGSITATRNKVMKFVLEADTIRPTESSSSEVTKDESSSSMNSSSSEVSKDKSSSSTNKSSSSEAAKGKSSSSKTDGIENHFDAPQFRITIANLSITISGARVGDRFAIFDMQGGVTRTGTIESNGHTVTVPRTGAYIVRVNNQVRKVNLR